VNTDFYDTKYNLAKKSAPPTPHSTPQKRGKKPNSQTPKQSKLTSLDKY
jgi:hypothetical protein